MTSAARPIVVTGGTGFVGRALVSALLARGERVIVLGRKENDTRVPQGAESRAWTPLEAGPWQALLDGARAVIHLAGEPVFGGRWTEEKKRRIRESRVTSTKLVVAAMESAKSRPEVLVSASAIGWYGAHAATESLDESGAAGDDFLARVVIDWEASADPAAAMGARLCKVRIGVVLGDDGGALAQMTTPFRLFVGGPIGDGTQVVSWIHKDDVVGILLLALDDAKAAGAINATAPRPVDMNELSRELGRALHRPSIFRVPAAVLRAALGEAADVVLTGARVLPRAAESLGYSFRYPEIRPALENLLGS